MKAIASVIALAVLLLVSGNAAAADRTFVIEYKNIALTPARIDVNLNDNVKIVLYNNDTLVLHDFHIDGYNIHRYNITGGSMVWANFTASTAGSFEYRCKFVGHETMKGTLVVKDPNAKTPGPEFVVLLSLVAVVVALTRFRGKRLNR